MLSLLRTALHYLNAWNRLAQWRTSRPSYQTWRLFGTEILTSTGSYITFYLADFFLMKRALHFVSKLNSRDIQKCNCLWVPMICSPLLAKHYFPRKWRLAFTDWETRVRLRFLIWSTIMATTRPIGKFHCTSSRAIVVLLWLLTSSIPSPPLSMYFSFKPFLDCEALFLRNISLCFLTSRPFRTHLLR